MTSKAETDLYHALVNTTIDFGYQIKWQEHGNIEPIRLGDRIFTPDFYIPEIDLYIEYSGCNYLPKLRTLGITFQRPGNNVCAIIDIAGMTNPTKFQIRELLSLIKERTPIEDIVAISKARYQTIITNFLRDISYQQ